MRRATNLFGDVVAFDNLHRSFLAASHGKRDRPEVRDFEYHLELRLWQRFPVLHSRFPFFHFF